MKLIYKYQTGRIIKKLYDKGTPTEQNDNTYIKSAAIQKPPIKTKYLSLSDGIDEINKDGYDPSVHYVYDTKDVEDFFQNDVAPRLKRENPKATNEQIGFAYNVVNKFPVVPYYDVSYDGAFSRGYVDFKHHKYIGSDLLKKLAIKVSGNPNLFDKYRGSPVVYQNLLYKPTGKNLAHEFTHLYRQGQLGGTNGFSYGEEKDWDGSKAIYTGYNNKEAKYLNNAYDMRDSGPDYYSDQNYFNEKGTTNTEVRYRIWKELKDKLKRTPTLKETDEYIKNYDSDSLLNMISNINGYGFESVAKRKKENVNAIKNALIHVAQNDSQDKSDNQPNYAKRGTKLINKNRI